MTRDELIDLLEIQRWDIQKVERVIRNVESEEVPTRDLGVACDFLVQARGFLERFLRSLDESSEEIETDCVRDYLEAEPCQKATKSSETSSSERD